MRITKLVPLVLLAAASTAAAQESTPALFPEPAIFSRAVDLVATRGGETTDEKDGWYVETGHMVTGAGWISLGPGVRHRLFNTALLVDASTAVSWRAYKMAQARVELPGATRADATIGAQVLWRDMTQIVYFGAGPFGAAGQASDYRMQATDAVAYATARPARAFIVSARFGLTSRPGISASTGPFDRDLPDTSAAFPADPGAALPRQPGFLHADVSVVHDTRDAPGHPTRGGLSRGAWSGFADRRSDRFAFERYELEAVRFVPLASRRVVVAVHGWSVLSSRVSDEGIPFYMLPSLGGANTLRAYPDYRFHDRNLLLVSAESRIALLPHVDTAVFVDAGSVAVRPRDLDLARRSYGAGLRVHTGQATLVRFDLARGDEGWRLVLRLNDPFRLARVTRHTAMLPFVP